MEYYTSLHRIVTIGPSTQTIVDMYVQGMESCSSTQHKIDPYNILSFFSMNLGDCRYENLIYKDNKKQ
mgnify:CR=1 FL=1